MTESLRGRWVSDLLPEFIAFAESMKIASKEEGVVTLSLMSSQYQLVYEIFSGLDQDIHDFVIVASRQIGKSTVLWALDLWWLQKFPAMQALYISDDSENTEIHRRTLGAMYKSLPPKFTRGPFSIHNRIETTWDGGRGWAPSRIMWTHASAQNEGQLGRSRGVNYVHGEEIDGWQDRKGVNSLTAALAKNHPTRLYLWVGTGQSYGLLYEMWEQAGKSTTSKQIFLGFWRLNTQRITEAAQPKQWTVYGKPRPSPDELEWMREVKKRYGHVVDREVLAWWRKELAEGKGINGDEASMLQENPWLPEQSFQSSGSQFLSSSVMLSMHHEFARAPKPKGFRYDWGHTFDEKFTPDGDQTIVQVPLEQAILTVWEQPDPAGLYVVAGDPAYGSSETADRFAITIWRCWPDSLVQVAEYQTPIGTMYQFAWTLAHLAGSYPRWLIYDVNGPGAAVLQELKRMQELGFGLTVRGSGIQDVVSRIQTYLWSRPDALSSSFSWGWKTSGGTQEQLMEQLRDMCERGMLVVRSRALWSELGALRRDGSRIEAGGVAHDDLAVTAAMAVEYWLTSIVQEIEQWMAPKDARPTAQTEPTQRLVRGFMARMRQPGDEEPAPRQYGVRSVAPGR